jgi:hypothetical protein
VEVHYHPDGFENDISDSDDHQVELFQPSVTIDKSGTIYSKATDDVTYTYLITNTSSADSPNLILDSLVDTGDNNGGAGLGDLTGYASYNTACDNLAPGAFCTFDVVYTVLAGDDDPLDNTVTVNYNPDGFENDIGASDDHSVDLIHPSFTVAKTCDAEPVSYLGPANFTVTIENTGDVPLIITADDGIGTFTLNAGASQFFPVIVPGPFTPGGTVDNTVTASWVLPEEYGLDNTDEMSASDSCDVVQPVFETAFALGDAAVCFTDLGASNWGWVNGDGTAYILPGDYTWDVWAGAAHCDTNNGTLVGTVTVNYDGTVVFVTFNIDPAYILGDTHIYAGLSQIPPGGFSPGQWEIEGPFSGEAIYIIVHAVVGVP